MVIQFHVFEFGAEMILFDKVFGVLDETYNVDIGFKHVEQIVDKFYDVCIHVLDAIFQIHFKGIIIRHPAALVDVVAII